MTASRPVDFPKPSLLRRLAAIAYDTILLCALILLIGGVWISLTENGSLILKWGIRLITLGVLGSFFIYFWLRNGQTLGMTTWRIRLRRLDGSKLSLKPILLRLMAASLSITCLGLGYLWMLIDKDKLTWHDRISQTGLELLAKKKK